MHHGRFEDARCTLNSSPPAALVTAVFKAYSHSLLGADIVQAVTQPVAAAPAARNEGVKHKTVVHQPHPQQVGIGVGVLVGGLLGNQVGGGRDKTLATIAGAMGTGSLDKEIVKRNP